MPLRKISRDMALRIASQYPQLAFLNLSNNAIENFENLHILAALQELDLGQNNISELNFQELVRMKNLQKLDLSSNNINSVLGSDCLKENHSLALTHLDLSSNPLSGCGLELLETISKISSIRHLNLTNSSVAALPNYRNLVALIIPQLQTLDGVELSTNVRPNHWQVETPVIVPVFPSDVSTTRVTDAAQQTNEKDIGYSPSRRDSIPNPAGSCFDDVEKKLNNLANEAKMPVKDVRDSTAHNFESFVRDVGIQADITESNSDIEIFRLKMIEEDLRMRALQLQEERKDFAMKIKEIQTCNLAALTQVTEERNILREKYKASTDAMDQVQLEHERALADIKEKYENDLRTFTTERDEALETVKKIQAGSNEHVVKLVETIQSLKTELSTVENELRKIKPELSENKKTIKLLQEALLKSKNEKDKITASLRLCKDELFRKNQAIASLEETQVRQTDVTRNLNAEEKSKLQAMEQLMRAQDAIIAREAKYSSGQNSNDGVLAVKLAQCWRSKVFELLVQLNSAKISEQNVARKLRGEISKLNKDVEKIQHENMTLLQERNEATRNHQNLQLDLHRARSDLSLMENQIINMKRTLEVSVDQSIKEFANKCNIQTNMIDNLLLKLEQTEAETEQLKHYTKQRNITIKVLRDNLVSAETDKRLVRTLREKCITLEANNRNLTQSRDLLEQDLEACQKNSVLELEKTISEMDREHDDRYNALIRQRDQMKRENASLTVDVRQLQRQLAKIQEKTERDDRAHLAYMEDKLKRKEKESHNLRRERNALLSAVREAERRELKLQEYIDKVRNSSQNKPKANDEDVISTCMINGSENILDDQDQKENRNMDQCRNMESAITTESQSIRTLQKSITSSAAQKNQLSNSSIAVEKVVTNIHEAEVESQVNRLANLAAKLLCEDEDEDSDEESL